MRRLRRVVVGTFLAFVITGLSNGYAGFGLNLGVKAGSNFYTSAVDTTTATAATSKLGVGVTGFAAFDLIFTDMLSVEIDLGWITRGQVQTAAVAGTLGGHVVAVGDIVHTGFNTLSAPVIFKLRFLQGNFIPYVGVGVDPYLIVSSASTKTAAAGGTTNLTLGTTGLNTFGVGVIGNLGFVYYLENFGITFDARYNYAFTDITASAATTANLQEVSALLGVVVKVM